MLSCHKSDLVERTYFAIKAKEVKIVKEMKKDISTVAIFENKLKFSEVV